MTVHELTAESADGVVDSADLALITFSSPGCRACREFAPTFEAAATRHPDISFCRVDTREQTALARAFEVRSVPMTAVLREQILLLMQPGALTPEALEEVIEKAKALDMDALRRDIAREADEETGS